MTSVLPRLSLQRCSPAELAASIVCCLLGLLLYRRFFAPLKNVPGPFWASLGRLWHTRMIMGGDQGEDLLRLHKEYGKCLNPR